MSILEKTIGYKFKNPQLIEEALTHPSLCYETKQRQSDNQRLEFLGDAVIQLVLTEKLYKMFPKFAEGRLTKLRSQLVSRDALQEFASSIKLGQYIKMGKGEEASGGRNRPSTLADTFESIIGAIYLDGGLDSARATLEKICSKWIAQVAESPQEKNPKGQLQEKLQTLAPESPLYEVLDESGPAHNKSFTIRVRWAGINLGTGTGNSKKDAETKAAADALNKKDWLNFSK